MFKLCFAVLLSSLLSSPLPDAKESPNAGAAYTYYINPDTFAPDANCNSATKTPCSDFERVNTLLNQHVILSEDTITIEFSSTSSIHPLKTTRIFSIAKSYQLKSKTGTETISIDYTGRSSLFSMVSSDTTVTFSSLIFSYPLGTKFTGSLFDVSSSLTLNDVSVGAPIGTACDAPLGTAELLAPVLSLKGGSATLTGGKWYNIIRSSDSLIKVTGGTLTIAGTTFENCLFHYVISVTSSSDTSLVIGQKPTQGSTDTTVTFTDTTDTVRPFIYIQAGSSVPTLHIDQVKVSATRADAAYVPDIYMTMTPEQTVTAISTNTVPALPSSYNSTSEDDRKSGGSYKSDKANSPRIIINTGASTDKLFVDPTMDIDASSLLYCGSRIAPCPSIEAGLGKISSPSEIHLLIEGATGTHESETASITLNFEVEIKPDSTATTPVVTKEIDCDIIHRKQAFYIWTKVTFTSVSFSLISSQLNLGSYAIFHIYSSGQLIFNSVSVGLSPDTLSRFDYVTVSYGLIYVAPSATLSLNTGTWSNIRVSSSASQPLIETSSSSIVKISSVTFEHCTPSQFVSVSGLLSATHSEDTVELKSVTITELGDPLNIPIAIGSSIKTLKIESLTINNNRIRNSITADILVTDPSLLTEANFPVLKDSTTGFPTISADTEAFYRQGSLVVLVNPSSEQTKLYVDPKASATAPCGTADKPCTTIRPGYSASIKTIYLTLGCTHATETSTISFSNAVDILPYSNETPETNLKAIKLVTLRSNPYFSFSGAGTIKRVRFLLDSSSNNGNLFYLASSSAILTLDYVDVAPQGLLDDPASFLSPRKISYPLIDADYTVSYILTITHSSFTSIAPSSSSSTLLSVPGRPTSFTLEDTLFRDCAAFGSVMNVNLIDGSSISMKSVTFEDTTVPKSSFCSISFSTASTRSIVIGPIYVKNDGAATATVPHLTFTISTASQEAFDAFVVKEKFPVLTNSDNALISHILYRTGLYKSNRDYSPLIKINGAGLAAADPIYVDPQGSDTSYCGPKETPCLTIYGATQTTQYSSSSAPTIYLTTAAAHNTELKAATLTKRTTVKAVPVETGSQGPAEKVLKYLNEDEVDDEDPIDTWLTLPSMTDLNDLTFSLQATASFGAVLFSTTSKLTLTNINIQPVKDSVTLSSPLIKSTLEALTITGGTWKSIIYTGTEAPLISSPSVTIASTTFDHLSSTTQSFLTHITTFSNLRVGDSSNTVTLKDCSFSLGFFHIIDLRTSSTIVFNAVTLSKTQPSSTVPDLVINTLTPKTETELEAEITSTRFARLFPEGATTILDALKTKHAYQDTTGSNPNVIVYPTTLKIDPNGNTDASCFMYDNCQTIGAFFNSIYHLSGSTTILDNLDFTVTLLKGNHPTETTPVEFPITCSFVHESEATVTKVVSNFDYETTPMALFILKSGKTLTFTDLSFHLSSGTDLITFPLFSVSSGTIELAQVTISSPGASENSYNSISLNTPLVKVTSGSFTMNAGKWIHISSHYPYNGLLHFESTGTLKLDSAPEFVDCSLDEGPVVYVSTTSSRRPSVYFGDSNAGPKFTSTAAPKGHCILFSLDYSPVTFELKNDIVFPTNYATTDWQANIAFIGTNIQDTIQSKQPELLKKPETDDDPNEYTMVYLSKPKMYYSTTTLAKAETLTRILHLPTSQARYVALFGHDDDDYKDNHPCGKSFYPCRTLSAAAKTTSNGNIIYIFGGSYPASSQQLSIHKWTIQPIPETTSPVILNANPIPQNSVYLIQNEVTIQSISFRLNSNAVWTSDLFEVTKTLSLIDVTIEPSDSDNHLSLSSTLIRASQSEEDSNPTLSVSLTDSQISHISSDSDGLIYGEGSSLLINGVTFTDCTPSQTVCINGISLQSCIIGQSCAVTFSDDTTTPGHRIQLNLDSSCKMYFNKVSFTGSCESVPSSTDILLRYTSTDKSLSEVVTQEYFPVFLSSSTFPTISDEGGRYTIQATPSPFAVVILPVTSEEVYLAPTGSPSAFCGTSFFPCRSIHTAVTSTIAPSASPITLYIKESLPPETIYTTFQTKAKSLTKSSESDVTVYVDTITDSWYLFDIATIVTVSDLTFAYRSSSSLPTLFHVPGSLTLTKVKVTAEPSTEDGTVAPIQLSNNLIRTTYSTTVLVIDDCSFEYLQSPTQNRALIYLYRFKSFSLESSTFTNCCDQGAPAIYTAPSSSSSFVIGSEGAVTFTNEGIPQSDTICLRLSSTPAQLLVDKLSFSNSRASTSHPSSSDFIIHSSSFRTQLTPTTFPVFLSPTGTFPSFSIPGGQFILNDKAGPVVYLPHTLYELTVGPGGTNPSSCGTSTNPCSSLHDLFISSVYPQANQIIVNYKDGIIDPPQSWTISSTIVIQAVSGASPVQTVAKDTSITVSKSLSISDITFSFTTGLEATTSNLFNLSSSSSDLELNHDTFRPTTTNGITPKFQLSSPIIYVSAGSANITSCSFASFFPRSVTGVITLHNGGSLTIDDTTFTDCSSAIFATLFSLLTSEAVLKIGENRPVTFSDTTAPKQHIITIRHLQDPKTILLQNIKFTHKEPSTEYADIFIGTISPSEFVTSETFPVLKDSDEQMPTLATSSSIVTVTAAEGDVSLLLSTPLPERYLSPDGKDDQGCEESMRIPCKTLTSSLSQSASLITFLPGTHQYSSSSSTTFSSLHIVRSLNAESTTISDLRISLSSSSSWLLLKDLSFIFTSFTSSSTAFSVKDGFLNLQDVNIRVSSSYLPKILEVYPGTATIRGGIWDVQFAASERNPINLIELHSSVRFMMDGTIFNGYSSGNVINCNPSSNSVIHIGESETVTFHINRTMTNPVVSYEPSSSSSPNIDILFDKIIFTKDPTITKDPTRYLYLYVDDDESSQLTVTPETFPVVLNNDGDLMLGNEATYNYPSGSSTPYTCPILSLFPADSITLRYIHRDGTDDEDCGTYSQDSGTNAYHYNYCQTLAYVFGVQSSHKSVGIAKDIPVTQELTLSPGDENADYAFTGAAMNGILRSSPAGVYTITAPATFRSLSFSLPPTLGAKDAFITSSNSLTLTSVSFEPQEWVRSFTYSLLSASAGAVTWKQVSFAPDFSVQTTKALVILSGTAEAVFTQVQLHNAEIAGSAAVTLTATSLTLDTCSFKDLVSTTGTAGGVTTAGASQLTLHSTLFTRCGSFSTSTAPPPSGALSLAVNTPSQLTFSQSEPTLFTFCYTTSTEYALLFSNSALDTKLAAARLLDIIHSDWQTDRFMGYTNKAVDLAAELFTKHDFYVDNAKTGTSCDSAANACATLARVMEMAASGSDTVSVTAHTDYTTAQLTATFFRGISITGAAADTTTASITQPCFIVSEYVPSSQTVAINKMGFTVAGGPFLVSEGDCTVALDTVTFKGNAGTVVDVPVLSISRGDCLLTSITASDITFSTASLITITEDVGAFTLTGTNTFTSISSSSPGPVLSGVVGDHHTLSLSSATFTSCTSTAYGGAISITKQKDADLVFSSLTFTDCTAPVATAVFITCTEESDAHTQSLWTDLISENTETNKFVVAYSLLDGGNAAYLDMHLLDSYVFIGASRGTPKDKCGTIAYPCATFEDAFTDVPTMTSFILVDETFTTSNFITISSPLSLSGLRTPLSDTTSIFKVGTLTNVPDDAIFTVAANFDVQYLSFVLVPGLTNTLFSLSTTDVTLSLTSILFTRSNSSSSLEAPVITTSAGTLSLTSITVSDLSLAENAFLEVTDSAAVTISSSLFESVTRVEGAGAAVHYAGSEGSSLSIASSTFRSCRTRSGSGGALSLSIAASSSVSLIDSLFEMCSCLGGSGGALSVEMTGGSFSLGDAEKETKRMTFIDCAAMASPSSDSSTSARSNAAASSLEGYGGALFLDLDAPRSDLTLSLAACTIQGSLASQPKGGDFLFVATSDPAVRTDQSIWSKVLTSTPPQGVSENTQSSFYIADKKEDGEISEPVSLKPEEEGGWKAWMTALVIVLPLLFIGAVVGGILLYCFVLKDRFAKSAPSSGEREMAEEGNGSIEPEQAAIEAKTEEVSEEPTQEQPQEQTQEQTEEKPQEQTEEKPQETASAEENV